MVSNTELNEFLCPRRAPGRELSDLAGLIRANQFADSSESSDSRELFQGSRTEPILGDMCCWGLKIANHSFEAIRANCSNVLKIGDFPRFDSCESIRANRPDPHCNFGAPSPLDF